MQLWEYRALKKWRASSAASNENSTSKSPFFRHRSQTDQLTVQLRTRKLADVAICRGFCRAGPSVPLVCHDFCRFAIQELYVQNKKLRPSKNPTGKHTPRQMAGSATAGDADCPDFAGWFCIDL
jgi:hypothetical protein